MAPETAPTNAGDCLVLSRRHVGHPATLTWDETIGLADLVTVEMCAAEVFDVPNVTVRINWGPPGQHTPHLHVHAVPRRPDDGHDGYMPGPLFPVTAAEAAAFVRTLGRSPYLRQSALTAESLPPLARPLQIRDFAIDTLEPGHP